MVKRILAGGAGGAGEADVLSISIDGAKVEIPDAHLLFTGQFSRSGSDLVIVGEDGQTIIVVGYFAAEEPPILTADGAWLTGDVIAALAGPLAPGQYAQAGTSDVATGGSAPIGQVETLSGKATVTRTDGTVIELKVGDKVFKGDVVATEDGASLGIVFLDETVFTLSSGSRMVLNELVYQPGGNDNSMLMNLVQGTFVFVAGKVAPSGDMKIETPVATMGIRGTTGIINIKLVDGAAEISGAVPETTFKIAPDPGDGKVGSYELFDKATGALLGTVEDTGTKLIITEVGGTPIEVARTPEDLFQDQAALNAVYNAFSSSQQRIQSGDNPVSDNGTTPTDDGTQDDGTTDDDATDDGSTDDGATDDGTGEEGAAEDGAAEDGAAEDGAPEDGAPDDGGSDDGAPDDTGSVDGPGNQAPGDGAGTPSPSGSLLNAANSETLNSDGLGGSSGSGTDTGGGATTNPATGGGDSTNSNAPSEPEPQPEPPVVDPIPPEPEPEPVPPVIDLDGDDSGGIAGNSFVASFTGSGAPVSIADTDVTITDADDTTIESATITLVNQPDGGDEGLSVSGSLPSGITAVGAGTGELVLTGSASLAEYQDTIAQVQYNNTSSPPDPADRTITVVVNDGESESTATSTIIFNDPPTLDLDDDNSSNAPGADFNGSFTEGGGPVSIADTDVTITDIDDTNIESATITLTDRPDGGSESLSVSGSLPTGVTASAYNPATGELVLTGSATLADYQAAIEQVQYDNTSVDPSSTDRTIEIVVNDGDDDSNTATATISVNALNDAPDLDLDGDDSSDATGADFDGSFTEGGGPVSIADTDVTITDIDDTNIESATITLTNRPDGGDESLSVNGALPTGITETAYNSATGELLLTGSATLADYQAAIAQIQYDNTSTDPTTANRTITVVVNDGDDDSNISTSTISVGAANDAPVLDLDASDPGPAFAGSFFEDGGPVDISDGVVITDADDTNIESATITLTNIANGIAESLSVNGLLPTGITTTGYSSGSGQLVLTGSASLADYQTAIAQIQYDNTSQGPDIADRIINVVVNDGDGNSNTAVATLSIIDDFDPPVITDLDGDSAAYNEGDGPLLLDQGTLATVTDVDSPNFDTGLLRVRISAGEDASEDLLSVDTSGPVSLADTAAGSNVSVGGVVIGTLNVAITEGNDFSVFLNANATPDLVQTLVQALTYENTDSDNLTAGARTIEVSVRDTSDGTPVTADVTVNVAAVNDVPSLDLDANDSSTATGSDFTGSFTEGGGPVSIADTDVAIADADDTNIESATITLTNAVDGASEILSVNGALPTGITETAYNSATGELVLTGAASLADYQTAIAQIQYDNTNANPTTANRTITVVVNDGDDDSAAATSIISIGAANDVPTVDLDVGDDTAGGTAFAGTFTEDGGPVNISDGVLITDADDTNIESATITLTNAADGVSEILSVNGALPTGITETAYNSATGELVLTGSATLADYQAAIAQIQYNNTSQDPDTDARIINVVVNDGDGDSESAVAILSISAGNDAPVTTDLDTDSFTYTEGDGPVVVDQGTAATVADVDSADFNTGQLVVSITSGGVTTEDVLSIEEQGTGAGEVNTQGLAVRIGTTQVGSAIGGANGADLQITFNALAIQSDVQAVMRAITFENTNADDPTEGARNLRFTLSDGDGGTSTPANVAVTVQAANDAPVIDFLNQTLNYVEGQGPLVIDTLTPAQISDVDSTDFAGGTLTVAITSGGNGGEDELGIQSQAPATGAGNISVSGISIRVGDGASANEFATLSGGTEGDDLVITFNGTATPALVSDLASLLTFENNNADDPTGGARTVEITVTDGDGGTSAAAVSTITVNPVNDAPTTTGLAGDDLAYDEGDGAVIIDQPAAATFADVDSADLLNGVLTVSITNRVNGEDILSISTAGTGVVLPSGTTATGAVEIGGQTIGLFGSGGALGQNVVVTFNANATAADVQTLIRAITYENTNTDDPDTTVRTVRFSIADGDGGSTGNLDTTVTISTLNDAPTLDLDADDSSTATGADFAGSFTEGGGPVSIADSDVAIADADDTTIESATITLTNRPDGNDESLSVIGSLPTGIAAAAYVPGTGVLVLSGPASLADYQAAIAQIQYDNTSTDPSAGDRTITVVVNDGDDDSNLATSTISVGAANDTPVLDLDASDPGPAFAGSFFEDGGPVDISDGVVITDADDTNIESATITLTNIADGSAESLSVNGLLPTGITTTGYSSGSGQLVLTGSASLADYQAAIAQIQYDNTSQGPDTADRIINVVVNDGDGNSNTAVATISIFDDLDPPVIDNLDGDSVAYDEGDGPLLLDQGTLATVTDVDSANFDTGLLRVRITAGEDAGEDLLSVDTSGPVSLADTAAGSNVSVGGVVIGTLNVAITEGNDFSVFLNANATPDLVQTLVQALTYENTDSDNPSAGARAIEVSVRDNSDGSPVTADVTVTVAAVNDAPVIADLDGDTIVYTEGDGDLAFDLNTDALVSDVDSTNFDGGVLTVIIISGGEASEDLLKLDSNDEGVFAGTTAGSDVEVDGTIVGTLANDRTEGNDFVVNFNANATADDVQALVRALAYNNTDTVNPTSGARDVRVTVTDGDGGTSANADVTVNVTGANDAPVVGNLDGDSLAYSEGDLFQVLDQGGGATLTDADSTNFDGGILTATITSGEDATEDFLSVDTSGSVNLVGTTAGSNVEVGGTVVGTLANAVAAGNDFVVNLNGDATPANIQTLLQSLSYLNSDNLAPTEGARNVRVTVSDGDGGTSANADITVTVTAVDDLTSLGNISGDTLIYNEGDGAQIIDQGAPVTISDVDSPDFNGGFLFVTIVPAVDPGEDVLGIQNQGTGTGQISVSGTTVSFEGNAIGTFSGGTGGVELRIDFNTVDATPAAAQALARAITYTNVDTDDPTTGDRTVRFIIDDGDGGTATSSDATVTVNAVNDAPVAVADVAEATAITLPSFSDDIDALIVNDFNASGGAGPDRTQLLTNDGSGGLTASDVGSPDVRGNDVKLGDFDGDGDLDAIVAQSNGQDQLLTNQGGAQAGTEGTFVASNLPGGVQQSIGLAVGDVDSDGDLDVIVTHFNNSQTTNVEATLLTNDGSANFTASQLTGTSIQGRDAALADIDGDGDLDAIVVNDASANQLLINQGGDQLGTEGTFSASTLTGGVRFSVDAVLGDIDGDGDQDVLIGNTVGLSQVLTNNGSGVFTVADLSVAGDRQTTAIALGDLDNDGDLDAVISNGTSGEQANQVLINQGGNQSGTEGVFAATDIVGSDGRSSDVALVDIDGDGDLDAFITNNTFNNALDQTNQVLINDGTGTFTASVLDGGNSSSNAIAFGDLDGDGAVAAADSDGLPNIDLSPVSGSVATNDSDVDSAALSFALDAPVAGLTMAADGSYIFDPSDPAYASLAAGQTTSVVASYTVTDDDSATAQSTLTITLTGTDDAPTLIVTAADPTFTEDGAPQALFSAAAASTVDGGQTFTGFTLTVTNVSGTSDDRLTVDGFEFFLTDTNTNTLNSIGLDFTVSVTGSTATVVFSSGAVPSASLETLITGITYSNFSQDPTAAEATRVATVTELVDSGSSAGLNSNTTALSLVSTVTITPVNDAPDLDLDLNDSSGATGADFNNTFTEGGGSVAIGDGAESDLNISLFDDVNIESATITLTNRLDGADEFLLVSGGLPGGIVASAYDQLTGVITLTGTASKADYEGALEQIRYNNTSDNPDPANRIITVVVNDGDDDSNTATATITINPVNDAPVAGLDTASIVKNATLTGNVLSNDFDPDNDTLSAEFVGRFDSTNGGSVVLEADGTFTYKPPADFTGLDTFLYSVTDGNGESVIGYAAVNVEDTLSLVDLTVDQSASTVDEFLQGNGGSDILTGGSGNDTVFGGGAPQEPGAPGDLLVGNDGNDVLKAEGGVTILDGGAGDDTLTSDDDGRFYDFTRADYSSAQSSIVVNLAAGTQLGVASGTAQDGLGGTDTLSGIHQFRDSSTTDDSFFFDGTFTNSYGDWIDVRLSGGTDTVDFTGATGTRRVSFTNAATGVTASLATRLAVGGLVDANFINANQLNGSKFDDNLTGDGNDNRLRGSDGVDTIDGGGGTDRADYLDSTNGIVVDLTLGSGQVVDDGFGNIENLTSIEDVAGSLFDDQIAGDGSENKLIGRAGNDTLAGNGGDDTLIGDFGDPVFSDGGFGGNDILDGGAGNDQLFGGDGDDTLFGGAGDDDLFGGSGNDLLFGGPGNDTLDLGTAPQLFLGIDIARGGDGDDTIIAAGGFAIIIGGAGADAFELNDTGQYFDWINVSYSTSSQGIAANLTDSTINFANFGGTAVASGEILDGIATTGNSFGEIDTFTTGNVFHVLRDSPNNDEIFWDGTFANSFGPGFVEVRLSAGDDLLDFTGAGGIRRVSYQNAEGGVDIDMSAGAAGSGTATDNSGGSFIGTDTITNANSLRGSYFDDVLTGDLQATRFRGSGGNDIIEGDAGAINRIEHGDSPDSVVVDLRLASNQVIDDGFGTSDTLTNIQDVRGGDFDDDITGDSADNLLIGGRGDDTLRGDDGDDTLIGGDGHDTLIGGNDDDFLEGRDGDDGLEGGAGNDSLFGGSGDDALKGGANNDLLDGGDGDDLFEGGDGNDVIRTGDNTGFGDEVIAGLGEDIIDFEAGQGFYTIDYSGLGSAVDVDLTLGGIDKGAAGVDVLLNLENINNDIGGLGIQGTAGADTFVGSTNDQAFVQFRGGAGNDTIFGGSGYFRLDYRDAAKGVVVDLENNTTTQDGFDTVDTLLGGIHSVRGSNFDDTLTGDADNNQFIGRGGDDTMDGGDGLDLVRYDRSGVGAVNIDLSQSTDNAQDGLGSVDTLINIEKIRGSRNDDDTIAGSSGDEQFDGRGGDDALLGRGGDDKLIGRSGDDVLTGGDGYDSLRGGSGANTFVFESASAAIGVDYILDYFAGNNLLDLSAILDPTGFTEATASQFIKATEANGNTTISVDLDGAGAAAGFVDIAILKDVGAGQAILYQYAADGSQTTVSATSSGANAVPGTPGNDNPLNGTGAADIVSGLAGDDTLDGGDSDDFLDGGAGFDTLIGGAGSDVLDGGGAFEDTGEFDVLDYSGHAGGAITVDRNARTVTDAGTSDVDIFLDIEMFIGTSGDDTFIGGFEFTQFAGLAGADTIDGGDGAFANYLEDANFGGLGAVTVNLSNAQFTSSVTGQTVDAGKAVDGFGDIDTLTNIDFVVGTNADDEIVGDFTNDWLEGNGGADTIRGGGGNDEIYGATNFGADTGNDTLFGDAGNDQLFGSGGNDTLNGGADNDILDGGAGDDTLDGGAGTDTASYETATLSVSVDLASGTATGGDIGNDTIVANTIENVIGGSGNDTITGDANENVINGGGGNDFLGADAGDDIIDGGGAFDDTGEFDVLSYAAHLNSAGDSIVVDRNAGTVTHIASGDIDLFTDIEEILGSMGNDTFNGGDDFIQFAGLAGADTFNGTSGGEFVDYSQDNANNGGGAVSVNLSGNSVNSTVSGHGSVSAGTAIDGFGDTDTLNNISLVTGTEFGDDITGSGSDDLLQGLEGADTIRGGDGNDQLFGASDFSADIFADMLFGDEGDDLLAGSGGNDILDGGNGDDRLSGGDGSDTITTGTGLDVLVFEAGESGIDTITDFDLANDVLDLSALLDTNFNPGNQASYIQANFDAGNNETNILVDQDGAGTGSGFVQIATLEGVGVSANVDFIDDDGLSQTVVTA